MLTSLKRITPPASGRLIAVSDIHGHRHLFDRLMDKLGFSDADTLIIVGDMCERGPDSLGMIRRAMQLSARGNVHVLIGNVDLASLSFVTGEGGRTGQDALTYARDFGEYHGSTLIWEMCRDAGIDFDSVTDGDWLQKELQQRFRAELDFMLSLPTFLETPDYLFVHGGVPTGDVESLVGQEAWPYLKRDHFIDEGVCFDKYVIVGHWPANLYRADNSSIAPYIERRQRIIDIDGGCGIKHDAQLNALLLPRGEGDFEWTSVNDLEQYRALDAQAPSTHTPLHIRWGYCDVEVLDEQGDMARVRHIETGREMDVPASLLWNREKDPIHCRCDDVIDYELEVAPGDMLGLMVRTSRGCIVKKGDISGWYRGRMEKA